MSTVKMIRLLCGVLSIVALATARLAPKMRNGAPTSFAEHRLPEVSHESEHEKSCLFEAAATVNGNMLEWSQLIDCDSTELFGISFISKHLKQLTFELIDPNGQIVDLGNFMTNGSYPLNDDGTSRIDAVNFQLPGPVRDRREQSGLFGSAALNKPVRDHGSGASNKPVQGQYKLCVSAPFLTAFTSVNYDSNSHPSLPVQNQILGIAIIYNDSPVEIYSHLTSYELNVGKPVGLVALVSNDKSLSALVDVVDEAKMAILNPDGTERWIAMHDDGLHADGAAHDGVYGATFVPTDSGTYVWRAELSGHTAAGVPFQRSSQHLVRVAMVDVVLSGTGVLTVDSSDRVAVALDVTLSLNASRRLEVPSSGPKASEVHTYAELWTTAGVAVGWAMATTEVINYQVKLTWDARWLARAGVDVAAANFELRNAYISDLRGFVPMTTAAVITLTTTVTTRSELATSAALVSATANVNDEALFLGPRPQWIDEAVAAAIAAGDPSHVVLVHGYCSTSNPFIGKGHNWRQAHMFEDYNQNLPNDEFARRLDAFADSKGLTAWSGIGHSQGGIALLHLRSAYWSALDVAAIKYAATVTTGGAAKRLIQSVGTPWKGCSGAGSSANLIKVFGVACGANADLTPDGAALWLATVSETAAKDAYYYQTVSFKNTGFFDSSCNWATNLVLDSPNDGTTELIRADLKGGTNCGVTEQQCHTEGMNYPAQTSDMQRNALMDSLAI